MSNKKVVTINAQTGESEVEYRDICLTAEELAELEKMQSEMPEPEPTPEERIKELEEQLKAVTTILLGGE